MTKNGYVYSIPTIIYVHKLFFLTIFISSNFSRLSLKSKTVRNIALPPMLTNSTSCITHKTCHQKHSSG